MSIPFFLGAYVVGMAAKWGLTRDLVAGRSLVSGLAVAALCVVALMNLLSSTTSPVDQYLLEKMKEVKAEESALLLDLLADGTMDEPPGKSIQQTREGLFIIGQEPFFGLAIVIRHGPYSDQLAVLGRCQTWYVCFCRCPPYAPRPTIPWSLLVL